MLETHPAKIMVGVSAGEECQAALEYAAEEARRRGCGVHLVYALHPVWVGPPDVMDYRIVDGELRKVGADFLQECEREVTRLAGGELAVSTELVHGPVVPSLAEESEHAALVVLQHHRMHRPHHLPTMSVTNGVAVRAHAPVVAVPDDWHEAEEHPDVVAVGVEDVDTSSVVAEVAFETAQRLGATLRLVRSWFFSGAFDADVFQGEAGIRQSAAVRAEVERDFGPMREKYADVPSEVSVVHGRAADVLVSHAERARLLVVGRHQPALPLGSHLGPVTRTVLNHAPCPVLVVDPRGDHPAS